MGAFGADLVAVNQTGEISLLVFAFFYFAAEDPCGFVNGINFILEVFQLAAQQRRRFFCRRKFRSGSVNLGFNHFQVRGVFFDFALNITQAV